MQFTTLPGSDLSVSRLCLGTMTFGSPVAGPDAIRLVHYAAELGVNFIDTANMYEGYNRFAGSAGGVAEEIVGKAVAGRRADFVIAICTICTVTTPTLPPARSPAPSVRS